MKKLFVMLLLAYTTFSYAQNGQNEIDQKELVKICQGHGVTKKFLDSFESAKRSKEKWDEQMPYDRAIKSCNSEMYKEDDWWIVECSWTHVDNCPKCDKYVMKKNLEE